MAKKKKERTDFKTVLRSIRAGLKELDEETGEPIYSKEDLENHIKKKGWTQEEFDKAVVNHATIQVKKSSPKSYWGTIKGYMREVLDGVTIGYSDTVDKYLGAILDSDIDIIGDGSRKESFFTEDDLEYQKQLIAQERADYQKEFPVHSTIGNIGGAMATGGALTKGALTMLPRLAPSAQGINIAGKAIPASATNLGKDVALNTALGTGEGALYAYNKGQDVSEGAEFGGTAGAGTSLAVRALLNNPVSKAVGRFGQGVKEAVFPSKATPREQSLERILEDWELDGVDPIERLQRLKDLGLGEEARTAYLGKYNTQQTAKDAVNTRGKARVEVKDNLLEDMERNRTLTTGQMKEGLGFNDKGESLLKGDIIDEMKKQADPFYKEAYALPPINNPDLDRVLKTIDDTTGGDFYANAKKIAEREIELLPDELRSSAILPDEMPYGNVPVAVVDYVKQSVDDLIKSAKGNDRRTLIALKKKMLDIVDVETQIKAPTNNLDRSGRPLDPNTGTPQVDPATGQGVPNTGQTLLSPPQSLVEVGESPYAKARAIYSEGHSNLEAYDLGKKAYSNKSATEIQYEIDGLSSEAEKDLYRLGASTEAVTKLNLSTADTTNASKKLLSPEAKDKHKVLFADPAKAEQFTNRLTALSGIHKSASAMLPKSDTGATNVRLFAKNMADFVSAGGSLVKRAGVIGARKLTDTVQRKQALARNEEMGKLQMAKGDKKIAGIIDETEGLKKKKEKEFSQSLINRSLLTGALTNTEAQMLGTGGLLQ